MRSSPYLELDNNLSEMKSQEPVGDWEGNRESKTLFCRSPNPYKFIYPEIYSKTSTGHIDIASQKFRLEELFIPFLKR